MCSSSNLPGLNCCLHCAPHCRKFHAQFYRPPTPRPSDKNNVAANFWHVSAVTQTTAQGVIVFKPCVSDDVPADGGGKVRLSSGGIFFTPGATSPLRQHLRTLTHIWIRFHLVKDAAKKQMCLCNSHSTVHTFSSACRSLYFSAGEINAG